MLRKTHLIKLGKLYCNGREASKLLTTKNIKRVTCQLCKRKWNYHKNPARKLTKAEREAWTLPKPTKEMILQAEKKGREVEDEYRSVW